MRYAQIRNMDISNGEGVGVSLFVQGCKFHCKGCFNPETWDFNGGKEWTIDIHNKFMKLIDRPYIERVSLLGGECLVDENLQDIYNLVSIIKEKFPDKKLWLYTGYTLDGILNPVATDDFNPERDRILELRKNIVSLCDVIVDGKYVDELRDLTLRFRGSSNQNIWKKHSNGFINTTKV